MSAKPAETLELWAIVELMGHVKMAGRITEEERFGHKLGRIDIPDEVGGFSTQYFGGGSVYRITPVAEEIARLVAANNQPAPVYAWQFRQITTTEPEAIDAEGGESDEDDEESWVR